MLTNRIAFKSFVLASLIAVNLVPAIANASFTDVYPDQAFYDAIEYVQIQGIVSGYSDGTYRSKNTINRAEFTKILVGSSFDMHSFTPSGKPIFKDVNGKEWFAPYIEKAVQENIISGYGVPANSQSDFEEQFRLNVSFFPSYPINFAEASKIMVRAMHIEMKPTDAQGNWWDEPYGGGSTGTWWQPYVNALLRENALPPNWLPDQQVTRGEMAEMIYRLKTGKASSQQVPVVQHPSTTSTLTLYFYSKNDVEQVTYEATVPVTRIIPKTSAVADATLKALFAGPTPAEQAKGAYTMYELSNLREYYLGVTVRDGAAIVNFKPDALKYLNAAAGTQLQVKAAIEATLKHFPNIKSVEYSINGKIYTEWDA